MPLEDMVRILEESDLWLEMAYGGNHSLTQAFMKKAAEQGQLHRVILGTDTPSGTGVAPRGMLRTMALVASVPGVSPEEAVCMATGSAALAHNLESGFIREGKPADLVIMGKIQGASGNSALESLGQGNLLGISMVLIDGHLVIRERSLQTPPPERGSRIEKEG
jgi:enamidase